jgi:hypothetical protein
MVNNEGKQYFYLHQLTDEYGNLADKEGDPEGPDGFSTRRLNLEGLQEGDDSILGDGL